MVSPRKGKYRAVDRPARAISMVVNWSCARCGEKTLPEKRWSYSRQDGNVVCDSCHHAGSTIAVYPPP